MLKMNPVAKAILQPTICLFVVCLITTFLLAVTNQATEPVIAANTKATAERIYKEMLPEVEEFTAQTTELNGKKYEVQVGKAGGKTIGYVFNTQTNGYGGPVVVLTAMKADGSIAGAQILEMQETAGLGMNASKPEFIDQYKGKKSKLHVVKDGASKDDEIQAISAATITSKAVTKSVNTAMDLFALVNGKEAK